MRPQWFAALLIFAGALALFSRDNTFWFDYHPDEESKAVQVIRGTRNFHHPLVLVNTADVAVRVTGTPRNKQAVTVMGRWTSASFAAAGVALLALLAWNRYGIMGGLAVAVVVAMHGELYRAAHYFKEDSALLAGLAALFFAAEAFARKPDVGRLRWLGIAAALATSTKYVGIFAALLAVWLVWRTPFDLATAARLKHYGLSFLAALLVLNIPLGPGVSSPFRSVRREVIGVTAGHRGMQREVPHGEYVKQLREDVPPALLVLAAVHLALLCVSRFRKPGAWFPAVFAVLFFAILSCSPKTSGRYLLPVTALACAFSMMALADVASLLRGRFANVLSGFVMVIGTVLVAPVQAAFLRPVIHAFRNDDRVAFAAWIDQHVPPDALIVEDHRVNLFPPEDGYGVGKPHVKQRVLNSDFAADLGSIDEMRGWGNVYVAVTPGSYGRFLNAKLTPKESEKAQFERRREFYTRLFAEAQLVHEIPSGDSAHLQPGLKLYRLTPAP